MFPVKTEVRDNTNLEFLQHILADLFLIVLLGWPSHQREDNFLSIARDVPVFSKVPFRCFGHSLSDVTRLIKPQLPHNITPKALNVLQLAILVEYNPRGKSITGLSLSPLRKQQGQPVRSSPCKGHWHGHNVRHPHSHPLIRTSPGRQISNLKNLNPTVTTAHKLHILYYFKPSQILQPHTELQLLSSHQTQAHSNSHLDTDPTDSNLP
ncbi:hypothetical protein KC19_6G045700 [Ceratodon purpureus]|uniref:Uncharacterized protein n=1 Tax=Ceratodon purpureus TaxID=3225 RepID=A0A8T0HBZ0_CERPU|nr:hypothetical protein KC19_6G045700 [Ceratodon purpureus]